VYEAITRVRQDLPAAVTLVGFCGAPWTVATYMIAGRGTADQLPARLFAYEHPDARTPNCTQNSASERTEVLGSAA